MKRNKKKDFNRWEPFEEAVAIPKPPGFYETVCGGDLEMAEQLRAEIESQKLWKNNRYQVAVVEVGAEGYPPVLHLSIKRLDRKPAHDWRALQRIKNELVGEEYEAVEIYPPEEHLIDTSNQYHLWVFLDPEFRLPFGFRDGHGVATSAEAASMGAQQRPFV